MCNAGKLRSTLKRSLKKKTTRDPTRRPYPHYPHIIIMMHSKTKGSGCGVRGSSVDALIYLYVISTGNSSRGGLSAVSHGGK